MTCLWIVAGLLAPPTRVTAVRCESLVAPLAVASPQPRLSWVLDSPVRGTVQTAWQVQAASGAEDLDRDRADLWDSGRVASAAQRVVYRGRRPGPGRSCWYRVRVWDQTKQASPWSAVARWGQALEGRDWQASWIGLEQPDRPGGELRGASWLWLPGGDPRREAPVGDAWFRRRFELPAGVAITEAPVTVACDDQFTLFVNGVEAARSDGRGDAWRRPVALDLARLLRAGANVLAVQGTNAAGPAGLLLALAVRRSDGPTVVVRSDAQWRAGAQAVAGWAALDVDDRAWAKAQVAGRYGDQPWGSLAGGGQHLPPSPYLRREFRLRRDIRRAMVHVTALGLYELHLNGRRVGRDVFTPGWTDYRRRIPSQTYDVTDLVQRGDNVLGAVLGDGWYAGHVGLGGRERYGAAPRLLAQLEVEATDGSLTRVVTDGRWQGRYGPLLEGDLLMGEAYDARLELDGWDRPGGHDDGWSAVQVDPAPAAAVEPHPGVPVQPIEELTPRAVTEPTPGVFVFDLGQNMVGWARLRVNGPAGTRVTLRFAERLNPDGTIYTTNYRSARCTDTYVLRGGGEEVWEPRFTFRGFQYVALTGYPGRPGPAAVTGVVLHSAIPEAGSFTCSNEQLNGLARIARWGQKGNYLEVPTDCPQRDERLGWTGDAAAFIGTAAYQFDVEAFTRKWLVDLRDAQRPDGALPDVAPAVAAGFGTAAWGDAGTIVPWTLYQRYGDRQDLAAAYPSMARWTTFCRQASRDLIRPAAGYGDWLSIRAETPKDLLATAYLAWSAELTARAADALGRPAEAVRWRELGDAVRQAFLRAFLLPDGRLKGETQTALALALGMGLLPDEQRAAAVARLVADVESRGNHLSTGFVGTSWLLDALASGGRADVAYRLLLQDTWPSWGFMLRHGATTVWERWDGWTPERGFQDAGMNSFNHYAFGCAAQFLYETVAGLRPDPRAPGFERFIVDPVPGGGLTWARAELDAPRGRIVSHWTIAEGQFQLRVTVPANSTATVYLPARDPAQVTAAGLALNRAPGVREVAAAGAAGVRVGVVSGSYEFACPAPVEPAP